jgi:GTP-binding protein
MIDFSKASFLISAARLEQMPVDEGAEVVFAGRSNAGKSSALNALTRQKNLARTSKTPGRTQLLNVFELDNKRRLVDLPGYGYAKVPGNVKRDWAKLLDHYLTTRECLRGVVLLMDIRHPMQEFDDQLIGWAAMSNIAVHILLTKADKLKFGAQKNALLKVQGMIKDIPNVTIQLFSSLKMQGLDDLKRQLAKWYT